MGVPFSVLGKLGLPNVDSLTTDKAYEKYFKDTKDYKDFHIAFIDLCRDLNLAMPGKHYNIVASLTAIKKFHEETWSNDSVAEEQKKEKLREFMQNNVEEYKGSSGVMIWTGLGAPAGAVLLKRSGEKVPQLKKLRLNLVPNVIFVPSITLLSLVGARMLTIKSATANKKP